MSQQPTNRPDHVHTKSKDQTSDQGNRGLFYCSSSSEGDDTSITNCKKYPKADALAANIRWVEGAAGYLDSPRATLVHSEARVKMGCGVKGIIGLLGLALLGSIVPAASADTPPSMVEVAPPEASLRLVEEWWQWAESVPPGKSPIQDDTGANCAQDQQGPVWFLAGGYGSSKIHRVCTVPAGKALFFPIINMVYFPGPESNRWNFTCAQAKEYAELDNDTAMDLFASVDGVSVGDLKRFRVSSRKCFDIFARLPDDQQPYSGYPSATDGFWLLLKPLGKGHHVIKFGGRYNSSTPDYGHMIQDIEYELTVE